MLILPLSTELRAARFPYVTFAVMLLCLVIHWAQDTNRHTIEQELTHYCDSVYDASLDEDSLDYIRLSKKYCYGSLELTHSLTDQDYLPAVNERYFKKHDKELTEEQIVEITRLELEHYAAFSACGRAGNGRTLQKITTGHGIIAHFLFLK